MFILYDLIIRFLAFHRLFPCISGSSCSLDFLQISDSLQPFLRELEGGRFIEGEGIYWVVQFHWKYVSGMSRLHNRRHTGLMCSVSFITSQSSAVHKSTSELPTCWTVHAVLFLFNVKRGKGVMTEQVVNESLFCFFILWNEKE